MAVKLEYRVGSICRVDFASPTRLDVFYDEVPDEVDSGDNDCLFDMAQDLGNFLSRHFKHLYDLSELPRSFLITSQFSVDCYVVSWNFSRRCISVEERVSVGGVSVIDRFAEQRRLYAFMNPAIRR